MVVLFWEGRSPQPRVDKSQDFPIHDGGAKISRLERGDDLSDENEHDRDSRRI